MEVNIVITGKLDVAPDDFKRMQAESPDDLLRALLLSNARIQTKVTEIYRNPEKVK